MIAFPTIPLDIDFCECWEGYSILWTATTFIPAFSPLLKPSITNPWKPPHPWWKPCHVQTLVFEWIYPVRTLVFKPIVMKSAWTPNPASPFSHLKRPLFFPCKIAFRFPAGSLMNRSPPAHSWIAPLRLTHESLPSGFFWQALITIRKELFYCCGDFGHTVWRCLPLILRGVQLGRSLLGSAAAASASEFCSLLIPTVPYIPSSFSAELDEKRPWVRVCWKLAISIVGWTLSLPAELATQSSFPVI